MKGRIRVADHIKTGTTSRRPHVTKVLWIGTAEVLAENLVRVPAALVDTGRGPMAVVQFGGARFTHWEWWDARLLPCREWQDSDGNEVAAVAPEVAAAIDAFLATTTRTHEDRGKQLLDRARRKQFGFAQPPAT